MKKMWLVVVVITTFVGFCGCEKTPVVKNGGEKISIWECVIRDYATLDSATVTLTIDSTTNLVTISMYPDIDLQSDIHNMHPLWHGLRFTLRDNKLHWTDDSKYLAGKEAYLITKISVDKIELSYMGGWWADGSRPGVYLFNKKRG